MRFKFLKLAFIGIGIFAGALLSLQLHSSPSVIGSSPQDQIEVKKSLLDAFSIEQETLKKQLSDIQEKRGEAEEKIERQTSREVQNSLAVLRKVTALEVEKGNGIRITLTDNPNVVRTNFSAVNENFVQVSDLRDLVNSLFLHDAEAIAVNGNRMTPFVSLQGAFDSILVGNVQISPPFVIEATGNPPALHEAVQSIRGRAIQIFVDTNVSVSLPSVSLPRSLKYVMLIK